MTWAPSSLAEALDDVLARPPEPVPATVFDHLRHHLESSAREAATMANLGIDAGPLRLPKRRIEELLGCERRALANLHAGTRLSPELVVGTLLDLLTTYHVLGGTPPADPFRVATDLLDAKAEDDEDAADTLAWLWSQPVQVQDQIAATAADRYHSLTSGWPALTGWNPRMGETATAVLADGDVIVSGRIDITIGGGWCNRPLVVVEVKSGKSWRDHRADHHLYALLLGLRDDAAPAAVITCTAGDGALAPDLVDEDTLTRAAKRTSHAIRIAGELAGHLRAPATNPGPLCEHCADNARCPAVRNG